MALPLSNVTWGPYPQFQQSGASAPDISPLPGHFARGDFDLQIVQQPDEALQAIESKPKLRKPIDPPPIVELTVNTQADPAQHFMHSPYLFMMATLYKSDMDEPVDYKGNATLGSLSSSLHRLKNPDNKDGAYFVFGDMSVKQIGEFRLRFNLYDMCTKDKVAVWLGQVTSEKFRVVAPKDWRGLRNSTFLSRAFSDQGVRLRLRKEASNHKRPYSEMTETPQPQILANPMANPNAHPEYGNYATDTGVHAYQNLHPDTPMQTKRSRFSNDPLLGSPFHGNMNSQYADNSSASRTPYTPNNSVTSQSQYSAHTLPPPGSYGTPYTFGSNQAAAAITQAYQYPVLSNNTSNYLNPVVSQTSGIGSLLEGSFASRDPIYPHG